MAISPYVIKKTWGLFYFITINIMMIGRINGVPVFSGNLHKVVTMNDGTKLYCPDIYYSEFMCDGILIRFYNTLLTDVSCFKGYTKN